ncbi:MAG: phosphate ABC transporter substrate-binding protein [Pirellulales bacterium]|nr:phosphate ABC transporter substrate-binding protein [Pirellulales bacterium]
MHWKSGWLAALLGCLPLAFGGCWSSSGSSSNTICVEGSDTMVNVAWAWAKRYKKDRPAVTVNVSGGGSGRGIASLSNGTCDLADSSRDMTEEEIQRIVEKYGVKPIEHIVGYDALAVYVNKENPLDSISLEELAEIYGEDGKIQKWSQLGVKLPGGDAEITAVGRQNSSGTYTFFREHVLGNNRDYKANLLSQNGSKDVVLLVAKTPTAIGYSGMGYKTGDVKVLKISPKKGEPAVEPTIENAKNRSYPLTRPLQIFSRGEVHGQVKKYLDWIYGPEGQRIVENEGYVPL